jgi:hypothetical protein
MHHNTRSVITPQFADPRGALTAKRRNVTWRTVRALYIPATSAFTFAGPRCLTRIDTYDVASTMYVTTPKVARRLLVFGRGGGAAGGVPLRTD